MAVNGKGQGVGRFQGMSQCDGGAIIEADPEGEDGQVAG